VRDKVTFTFFLSKFSNYWITITLRDDLHLAVTESIRITEIFSILPVLETLRLSHCSGIFPRICTFPSPLSGQVQCRGEKPLLKRYGRNSQHFLHEGNIPRYDMDSLRRDNGNKLREMGIRNAEMLSDLQLKTWTFSNRTIGSRTRFRAADSSTPAPIRKYHTMNAGRSM
jgi:hypothetical protein